MALGNLRPTQARIRRRVGRVRRLPLDEQPVILAQVMQAVQHVDERQLPAARMPLKHNFLHHLDRKAIPGEPPTGGVAQSFGAT